MASTKIDKIRLLNACNEFLRKRNERIELDKWKYVEIKYNSLFNRWFFKRTRKELYEYFNSKQGRENFWFDEEFSRIEYKGPYWVSIVLSLKQLCELSESDTISITSEEFAVVYPYFCTTNEG